MRRILSLALCALLLGALTLPAFGERASETVDPTAPTEQAMETPAETGDGESTPASSAEPGDTSLEPQSEESAGSVLILDNKTVYDGMDAAYQNGYTPRVSENTAIVVLPLTSSGELKDNRLTASVDLGDASGSPFVYKNYQKDFTLGQQQVSGTKEEKSIYYVRFDLALSKNRVNGTYPVTINLTAQDSSGGAISQSFVTYVTITDGIDPNASEESVSQTQAETPTSSPVVLVTGYIITHAPAKAGGSFEATVTLKNTSTIKSVQNMVVTVESSDSNFTLLNDSDTIYISKLDIGESTELKLKYSVGENTPEGQYIFNLSMTYDDPEAVSLSSSGRFTVSVEQPLEVQLTMPKVAASVSAGDTIPLSFQVLNLGRSKVYNVRCEITGVGLFPTSTAFVGDMESGSEGTASLNLFIGTKDMSEDYTGTDQYGSTTGVVTLYYENTAGAVFTQEFSFDTTIEKPVLAAAQTDGDSTKETAGQWWISIGILGGILVAAGVGFGGFALGKKRR